MAYLKVTSDSPRIDCICPYRISIYSPDTAQRNVPFDETARLMMRSPRIGKNFQTSENY